MAIGFARGIWFKLEERMTDPEGRFLFLRGRLSDMECTLAKIYASNRNPIKFLKNTLERLMDFKKGHVILMGDMNCCMEPGIDSTSRVQGTNNVQLKMIKNKLYRYQLVDTWRIFHPKVQDYMFYSPAHGTHSRIDYILVYHRALDWVSFISIEITTLSDHAPVKMTVPGSYRPTFSWRLNEDLRDEVCSGIVEKELQNYFANNDTEGMSTLWGAHKAYIRGILIEVGTRKKREIRKNHQFNQ